MSSEDLSCPSCGARVPDDADQCPLCGTAVAASPDGASASDFSADATPEESMPDRSASTARGRDDSETQEEVYCTHCGRKNPSEANYCSQCGTELADLADTTEEESTRPVTADLPTGETPSASTDATDTDAGAPDDQEALGTNVVMIVGTAVLVVVGLFFVTEWSRQYDWSSEDEGEGPVATEQTQSSTPSTSSPSAAPNSQASGAPTASAAGDLGTLIEELSGPVDGPVADQIDSLETLVDQSSGDQRDEHRQELVRLYVGAGAPGRAALVQSRLADRTGSVDDQRRAADLLYQWMQKVQEEEGRAQITDVARHVAEAYTDVAEKRPNDLDARTRMGEAFLLTNNPMNGIEAINAVLEDDSTFVPARFQKGLALLQINRLDQAVRQFEQVMEYASQDDPFYRQAERAIKVIREQTQSGGEGSSDAPTD